MPVQDEKKKQSIDEAVGELIAKITESWFDVHSENLTRWKRFFSLGLALPPASFLQSQH